MTDRATFLEERRTGIGGSDIAALDPDTGSPFASPWSVWASKVGLVPDRAPSDAMQLGLDLEPLIAEWFRRRTGLYTGAAQTLARHRRATWAIAHLDGLVYETDPDDTPDELEPLGVLELKYTGESWERPPAHYLAQVQWQMYATGLEHGWVAALMLPFGRPTFEVFEVRADHREQTRLATIADRFWHDHCLTGIAPPADGSSATASAIGYAYGTRSTVKVPALDFDDHRQLVDAYAALKRQERTIADELAEVGNQIRAFFGAAAGAGDQGGSPAPSDATIDGELAISWRSQTTTRLDTAAVRADHGDRYDKRTPGRVLRLHGRRAS